MHSRQYANSIPFLSERTRVTKTWNLVKSGITKKSYNTSFLLRELRKLRKGAYSVLATAYDCHNYWSSVLEKPDCAKARGGLIASPYLAW